jgi:N-methylhydantoinase B
MTATKSFKSDPVALAILQRQLNHITLQMGTIMTRTARSPIFSQSHDFSCFLSDRHGSTVAQADGLPIHSGGGGFGVRAVLRDFGQDIQPGDVFLLSDPYEAGGNHLPDWKLVEPVFVDGTLVGFSSNLAHQSDIGGGAAGTYNTAATEIFHEGIRLPVLRLFEKGKRREDLWRLLLLNSRTPDLMEGDLGAMLGTTHVGADRMAAVIRELGLDQGLAYLDELLNYGDRRMRQALAKMPEGIWTGFDMSDNDCFSRVDVETHVKVTKTADTVTFDFTGSSPQIKGFKNSSLANTYSCVYVALASFLPEDIPRNEGAFRAVKIVAPEGTHVNALPPAAMTMNTMFPAQDIMNACWDALAKIQPENACAGWGKSSYPVSSGKKPSGERFVLYHWHSSQGGGAIKGRDGFSMISHQTTLGGLTIPNVEGYEHAYPVKIHRQEMRCDAAGAGQFRGGPGVDYEVEMLVDVQNNSRGEGLHRKTGCGVNGGDWGAKGELTLTDTATGQVVECPQYGFSQLGPSRLAMSSAAGGGWGSPFDRDPQAVLQDVRDGIVSAKAAREVYGVEISSDGKSVASLSARQNAGKKVAA